MSNREKVIAWLADEELYYRDHGDTHNSLMACDALELLKEQEAVEPTWQEGKAFCGSCGLRIPMHRQKKKPYCPSCGRKVFLE